MRYGIGYANNAKGIPKSIDDVKDRTAIPENILFKKGEVIKNLRFDGYHFDIKITEVSENKYYDKFSYYFYSLRLKDNRTAIYDENELRDLLYPMSHVKLMMLVGGDLPDDYIEQ